MILDLSDLYLTHFIYLEINNIQFTILKDVLDEHEI